MRIPLHKLQIRHHVPLPLRPILLRILTIGLQIRHLDPLSAVSEMLQFDHRPAVGAKAWLGSRRGVVRAVGPVGGERESVCAAVGGRRGVGVAGVDHLVKAVDVVGMAVVGGVAFSGVVLGVGYVRWGVLWVFGVRVSEVRMLLHVLVLVLILIVEAWGLNVRVLHGEILGRWILHILVVLGVWVLHICVPHVRVLLLGLSLVGLCLGRLGPDEVFLLHVGDVVVVVGANIVAASKRCAVDIGAVVVRMTLQKDFQALRWVYWVVRCTVNGEVWL